MPRYIDADKFALLIYTDTEGRPDTFDDGVMFVLDKIDAAPTADVAPVVHAHWIIRNTGLPVCSHCEGTCVYKADYCPNCGAKMDEEENNEN